MKYDGWRTKLMVDIEVAPGKTEKRPVYIGHLDLSWGEGASLNQVHVTRTRRQGRDRYTVKAMCRGFAPTVPWFSAPYGPSGVRQMGDSLNRSEVYAFFTDNGLPAPTLIDLLDYADVRKGEGEPEEDRTSKASKALGADAFKAMLARML